jgi:putative phage-type endonuclease
MPVVTIESDEQWHALRRRNIGGSDVAALFGASPWMTEFTLWAEKRGITEHAVEENNKMALGKYLEPFIAGQLAKELGWTVVPSKEYHLHPTITGMGATLDFDVIDHEWGPGICETKVVFDYADYMEHWSDDRAPPHIELQVQHQLAVTGRPWAAICVLVMQTGTLMPAIIRRPIPAVIAEIEEKVGMFWESIKAKQRPAPTGTDAELSIMRLIWPAREPRKIVELANYDLAEEASLYVYASQQLSSADKQKTVSKAKLLAAAEDAELLRVPGFNINVKQDKRGYVRMSVTPTDANGALGEVPRNTLEAG